jgi:putative DNA primase/helicase
MSRSPRRASADLLAANPELLKEVERSSSTVNGPANLLHQGAHDVGNAERLIALHGGDLRFAYGLEQWLRWDGCRWQPDSTDQARELCQKTMKEFLDQAIRAGDKDLVKFALGCLNTHRVVHALEEARPHLAVTVDKLDSDPHVLNFLNGTLDLCSGELRRHQREDLISKAILHNYNPQAECPRFLAFVSHAVGRNNLRFLQKALGYSLLGEASEKLVFLLYGQKDTGKTTLLNLFHCLLGDYAGRLDIENLMAHHEDNSTRSDVADLCGLRLAITSETQQNQRLNEAKLKRLVQGQRNQVRARRLYQNWITFPESWTIFVDCNYKPIIQSTDDSIWERFALIVFPNRISAREIDRQLPEKLLREAEGALACAVQGCLCYQREGLEIPDELLLARNEWRGAQDRLGGFLEERTTSAEWATGGARAVYTAYSDWCVKAGLKPLSEPLFAQAMEERGIKKTTNRLGKFYLGVCLNDDAETQKARFPGKESKDE